MPSFADYLARHRLKATGEALMVDLTEARWTAAQRGKPIHLNFATGTQRSWLVAETTGCDCRVPQVCRIKTVSPSKWKGVELTSAEDAQFEPEGTGRGHAELRSTRGHALRVEVSAPGRARMCSPQGALPGMPAC
jgi:Tfp pilus assembly protein FimT